MAINITINNTPIEFPESGTSPNWAPAVIQFAQAVEAALNLATGPYDVSPQVLAINNSGIATDVASLLFQNSLVRGAVVTYSIFRKTDSSGPFVETGSMLLSFDGSTWASNVDRIGDSKTSLTITSGGQVQYTVEAISGTNYLGYFTFSAKAQAQT